MLTTIIVCFLIIGLLVSYLNGIASELTQDVFKRLMNSYNNNLKLQKIWDNYDEIISSLFLVQAFVLLFAVFLSGLSINFSMLPIPFFSIQISSFLLILGIVIMNFVFYFLGKRFTEKSIVKIAPVIILLTSPLLPIISRVMLLFIYISGRENDDVRIEEITDLVEEAREDGAIDAGEYRLLNNVMHFKDVFVSDVMTPRIVLFSCRANMTVAEAAKLPELQMYSRFPIWEGESIDDEIIGYVTTKEVFNAVLNGLNDKELKDLARTIHFVPENAELGKTLEIFLIKKQHLLLVVDEYGGIEGLITMEDVLETMLGVEIVDEADKVIDLRVLAKTRREARLKENYHIDFE